MSRIGETASNDFRRAWLAPDAADGPLGGGEVRRPARRHRPC